METLKRVETKRIQTMPWRELDSAQWAKLVRFGRYLCRFRKLWIILRDIQTTRNLATSNQGYALTPTISANCGMILPPLPKSMKPQ